MKSNALPFADYSRKPRRASLIRVVMTRRNDGWITGFNGDLCSIQAIKRTRVSFNYFHRFFDPNREDRSYEFSNLTRIKRTSITRLFIL